MTQVAFNEFRKHLDAIRSEAFAEGYAAAMEAVRALTSRSVPRSNGSAAAPIGNGTDAGGAKKQPGTTTLAIALRTGSTVRRAPPARSHRSRRSAVSRRRFARTFEAGAAGNRASRRPRAPRGTNARMVQAVLKAASPRAVRQAEIRNALQEKGVSLAYPSIGHALAQLEARKAARHGRSGTWRYSAAA